MRPLAILPAIFAAGAFVLATLCLFAGSQPDFMEDYHIMTLNVSRFGSQFLNTSDTNSSNPFANVWNSIENYFQDEINDAIVDTAEALGLRDWYSAHLMDYYYGNYTPAPVANLTLKQSGIHKDIEACSNRTALFNFDPHEALQRSLNRSAAGKTLSHLQWPKAVDDGIRALRSVFEAAFVLYCIAIGLIGLCVLISLVGMFANGRVSALLEILLASLAFITIGIASALMTTIAVEGVNGINKYGRELTIEARRGSKFIILTWIATGLMFFSKIVWCFECIVGRQDKVHYRNPRTELLGKGGG